MSRSIYASPVRAPETEPFWDAVQQGKLLLAHCPECGKTSYYPRSFCPFCFGETGWIEASGAGTVYSYTTVFLRDETYVVALVTLDEGPTVLTNIVETLPPDVHIGQPVQILFAQTDGTERALVFTAVEGAT